MGSDMGSCSALGGSFASMKESFDAPAGDFPLSRTPQYPSDSGHAPFFSDLPLNGEDASYRRFSGLNGYPSMATSCTLLIAPSLPAPHLMDSYLHHSNHRASDGFEQPSMLDSYYSRQPTYSMPLRDADRLGPLDAASPDSFLYQSPPLVPPQPQYAGVRPIPPLPPRDASAAAAAIVAGRAVEHADPARGVQRHDGAAIRAEPAAGPVVRLHAHQHDGGCEWCYDQWYDWGCEWYYWWCGWCYDQWYGGWYEWYDWWYGWWCEWRCEQHGKQPRLLGSGGGNGASSQPQCNHYSYCWHSQHRRYSRYSRHHDGDGGALRVGPKRGAARPRTQPRWVQKASVRRREEAQPRRGRGHREAAQRRGNALGSDDSQHPEPLQRGGVLRTAGPLCGG